jgi:hypothetical protein
MGDEEQHELKIWNVFTAVENSDDNVKISRNLASIIENIKTLAKWIRGNSELK